MKIVLPSFFSTSLLFLFFYILPADTFGQLWSWARAAGGKNWEDASAVVADDKGNVYAGGYFESQQISFGGVHLTNASSQGTGDIFIVKYDSSGELVWAKSAGGSYEEKCTSLYVDKDGTLLICGNFSSSNFSLGKFNLINSGNFGTGEIFIARLDSSGNFLWAGTIRGEGDDAGYSIKSDENGWVYVQGEFDGTLYFGKDTLITREGKNICLLKLTSDGNPVWARGSQGDGSGSGHSLSLDVSGNLNLTGSFEGSIFFFGKDSLKNNQPEKQKVFLVKYNSQGQVLWLKGSEGIGNGTALSTEADDSGNIFITGFFSGTDISFGKESLINTTSGGALLFLTKYSPDGKVLWARIAGGEGFQSGSSMCADTKGNIYLAGNFQGSSIRFGKTNLLNAGISGSRDIFLAEYDSSGKVVMAESFGGSGDDWVRSVFLDKKNNLYLSGYFRSPSVSFSGITLNNLYPETPDIFIAK